MVSYRKRSGPQPVLQGNKRRQVAKSAMDLKKEGAEPTYVSIAAKCPAAVRNPDTQKPVDKKQVYTVLKTACYDRVPAVQKPRVVFTDRGRGFYAPLGDITKLWSGALREGML